MKFQDFVEAVRKEVILVIEEAVKEERKDWSGKVIKVDVHTNLKNNGKELVGIIIRDDSINVAPTIYLEEYFIQMSEFPCTVNQIACSIVMEYEKVCFKKSWNVDAFHDYECIKDRIAFKLISLEKNKELLEDTPYISYLDLAIVFYVLVEVNEKRSASMLVKNMQVELWQVNIEMIYKQALKNVNTLLPAKFQTMTSVISEIVDLSEIEQEEERMYVLSNTTRHFGAACVLYPGKLKEIGEYLGKDYFILPSSIHEVIIVPYGNGISKDELEDMVCEVNETQVEEEEVLSDTVYYYRRDMETLLY